MSTTEESTTAPIAGSESPEAVSATLAPTKSSKPPRRLREWLWRSGELAAARRAALQLAPLEAERLWRARRAMELADRALDPVDPLRAGPGVAPSLSLYREAAFWALLAQQEASVATDLRAAFQLVSAEFLVLAAGGEERLEEVRSALLEKDFVTTAEDPSDVQRRDAEAARDFVHALVAFKLEPEARVVRLLMQRWGRTLSIALIALGLVVGGLVAARELGKGPDLAAGKPWQASSTHSGCTLQEHRCGPTSVKIFFHTEEEDQPWVRFDLGRPTKFSRVELVNRSDAGSDRGFPVVIEASDDAQTWRELARQDDSYSTWRASFTPVRARYVRARLTKRNWFHLERFSIYGS